MENRFQINFPLSYYYYYYYFRSVPIKEYDSFVWKGREGGRVEVTRGGNFHRDIVTESMRGKLI